MSNEERRAANMSTALQLPTNRRFGFTFTIMFALIGAYGIVESWNQIAWVTSFVISIVFGLSALIAPEALTALNKSWFRFGQLLGRFSSPIVLGVIFFAILTPIAAVTRLFGRDELLLKRRVVGSYWIGRNSSNLTAESFKKQF
jgi:hypothetical protein